MGLDEGCLAVVHAGAVTATATAAATVAATATTAVTPAPAVLTVTLTGTAGLSIICTTVVAVGAESEGSRVVVGCGGSGCLTGVVVQGVWE